MTGDKRISPIARPHVPDVPKERRRRPWGRGVLCVVVLILTLLPASVAGHASLIGTDPEDGAALDEAPETVTLSFTEPVEPIGEAFTLFDAHGAATPLEAEASGPDVIITLPGGLPDGGHVVGWRVISMDSHPISGAVTFTAGEAGAGPVNAPEASDIAPVLGGVQGVGYIALLGAVGLLFFGLVSGDDARERRLVLVLGGVAILAHILLVPLTEINETGAGLDRVFNAGAWRVGMDAPMVSVVIVIAVGLLMAVVATLIGGYRREAGILFGGLAAIAGLSLLGHTRTVEPAGVMYASDILHGTAGATWFGGLIGLGRYMGAEARSKPVEGARVVSRFSTVAGIVFALAAATGAVMAFLILDSVDALWRTTYGRLLIAKVALVAIPFGLAAWNRARLVPAVKREPDEVSAWRRLRGVVMAEVAVLVAVGGLTGFLVVQSPNVEGAAVEAPAAMAFEETAAFDGGSAIVRVEPGTRGENEVVVELRDDDGAPIALANNPAVELTLPEEGLGPLTSVLKPGEEDGTYGGAVRFPISGEWDVSLVMRISRFEQVTVTVTVEIP
jgi:copper transport protein